MKPRRLPGGRAGSTLIWALVVVLILSLVLTAGMTIVQRQHYRAINSHIENQAYYSAMSVNHAIVEGLIGPEGLEYSFIEGADAGGAGPMTDDPKALFLLWAAREAGDGYVPLAMSGPGSDDLMGSVETSILFEPSEDEGSLGLIYVRTTAVYFSETSTVIGSISNKRVRELLGSSDEGSSESEPPSEADGETETDADAGSLELYKVTDTWTVAGYSNG